MQVKTGRVDLMANILIVEDEKNMQNIICEYMRRGGHTCFTADDGVFVCSGYAGGLTPLEDADGKPVITRR